MQAARYQLALENYVAYMQGKTERQPQIGTKQPRQPSQVLYVNPFSLNIGTADTIKVSADRTAWDTHEGAFGTHTLAALPSGDVGLSIKNFRAARVSIVTGRSNAARTVKESHITKTKYLNYGGTSRSIPFGKTSAGSAETEVTVFQTIKTSLAPVGSTLKVYLAPEKY
jgi:hypothetical protein